MDSDRLRHLSPPPRSIPPILSIRVLFGGVLTQIGWGIMVFGLVFVWAFDVGGAISSAFRFTGELATAEGQVVEWRETNLTINDRRVYETSYSFRTPSGETMSGSSYRTGSYENAGSPVTIEYLARDPTVSRIQGMRASSSGLAISFVVVFPLVGLVLALVGMRKGVRARRLMSTGQLALGTLRTKEPTSTVVNNQPVYRYTFDFEAGTGGTYEAVGHTHRYEQLEDEEQERIVYDPRNPADAKVLDELPFKAHVDQRGDFVVEGAGQVLVAGLNLLLPALTLAAYAAYVMTRS